MGKIIQGSGEEKRMIWTSAIVVGVLVLIDQITKCMIIEKFPNVGDFVVITSFFNINHVRNIGAAWGMFSGYGYVLLTFSMIVLSALIYFMRQLTEGWRERYIALSMVASGIIGNSIDRIWHHSVVDFLDFHINQHHWPSFNIADSAITVGVAIFIISSFVRPETQKSDEPVESQTTDGE